MVKGVNLWQRMRVRTGEKPRRYVRGRHLTCLEDAYILSNCLVGDVNMPTSIAVVLNYLNSKRLSVCQH